MTSVELRVSLETDSTQLAAFRELAHDLGIDIHEKVRRSRRLPAEPVSEVPSIESEEEFVESTQNTFPLVPRRNWDFYTGTLRHMTPQWSTRSWNAAQKLADKNIDKSNMPEHVDMSAARIGIRSIEAGQRLFVASLGRTAWNAIAGLNNLFTETGQGRILEWEPDIHPRLGRGFDDERRTKAARELAHLYAPIIAQVELGQDFLCS